MVEMKDRNEVYADRNVVALGFLRALSEIGVDVYWRNTEKYKWPAIAADLPAGEVGWHIPRDERTANRNYDGPVLEDHTVWIPKTDREYQHYSREAKNDRIEEFALNFPGLIQDK